MSSPPAPSSLYAQRRARLAAQLGQGGIAIIPTAPERPRNRDNDFAFRHDSYFYYLTGFTEPGAALGLAHDGQSTLFCQPKDPERESWDGYRLGPAAAPAARGGGGGLGGGGGWREDGVLRAQGPGARDLGRLPPGACSGPRGARRRCGAPDH